MAAVNSVMLVLQIFGAVIISTVIFILLWVMIQYKHTVEIIQMLSSGNVVLLRKARLIVDRKTHVRYFKLLKMDATKRIMPDPPDYCIHSTEKGKLFIRAYLTQGGEYIFREDKISIKEIPPDLFNNVPKHIMAIKDIEEKHNALTQWKEMVTNKWMEEEKVSIISRPITTNQRVMHFTNLTRANDRKRPSLWDFVPQIVSIIMIFMFVIENAVLFAFWTDLTKPSMEWQEERTAQLQIIQEIAVTLQAVKTDTQILKEEQSQIDKKLEELETKVPK